ncbi:MAG: hypothetical protein HKO59_08500 [Phycisphaerales bacterium]|nr:hypothetical protein [Phycisphaerales bacterium]
MKHTWIGGLAAVAGIGLATPASGQCTTIDFEDYSVGQVVTSVSGVTFSAEPGSCGGGTPQPVIVTPTTGTSSGTRALSLQAGCPDFSPDKLRLVFSDLQRLVTFTLGEPVSPGVQFSVRAYSNFGALVYSRMMSCGGGVFHYIRIGHESWGPTIRRVEIESTIGLFEGIDDLAFDYDPTPPTALIDAPPYLSCECDVVTVRGIACDEDGEYGSDRLEYRRVNADPGTPWTLINSYTTPVCTLSSLYTWNTSAVSHGTYFLRLTVENACGLASTDITTVVVDKAPPTVAIESPQPSAAVCGEVQILGTVSEGCGHCFDEYVVEVAPMGGSYSLLMTSTEIVINGIVATWDTATLPSGDYVIRITAVDDCGNDTVRTIPVIVDPAACGCDADVDGDGDVDFTDLLTVLAGWGTCS